MSKIELNEIFQNVEMVTCVDNATIFLAESSAYLDRLGQEGGLLGMTKPKFDVVVEAGGGYEVGYAEAEGLMQIQMKDYAKYHELRTDHFKASLYAIAYIEAFGASIPSTKEGRFDLFALLFDHEADRDKYLSLTV